MIYLASPYSGTEKEMEQRYDAVLLKTSQLLSEGVMIFSPIVHCHVMALVWDMPTEFEFWQKYDEHMIDLAEEFWVLKLKGWDKSKGIAAELQYAENLGKSIRFIDG